MARTIDVDQLFLGIDRGAMGRPWIPADDGHGNKPPGMGSKPSGNDDSKGGEYKETVFDEPRGRDSGPGAVGPGTVVAPGDHRLMHTLRPLERPDEDEACNFGEELPLNPD